MTHAYCYCIYDIRWFIRRLPPLHTPPKEEINLVVGTDDRFRMRYEVTPFQKASMSAWLNKITITAAGLRL